MGEMSDKPVHPYLDHWCMTRPIEGMAKYEILEAIGILQAVIPCAPKNQQYMDRLDALKTAYTGGQIMKPRKKLASCDVLWNIPLKRKKRS